MSTRMLIDARHPEETRVAVVRGTRIEEFDFESSTKKQLKGNIYLAKVTRVEPSLQAAFVEYGGNRHGFLAFSEIHPDYYQIPHEDREALLEEEAAASSMDDSDPQPRGEGDDDTGEDVSDVGGSGEGDDDQEDDAEELMRRRRVALRRRYKIQEVIKRRQIMLVQVVKEERGGKGAALTTYLSLAGRYSVLMPNSTHGGGISRKISSQTDRRRLKSIMAELKLPKGMGCIIRTAGLKRTKTEIKRDFDYLTRLWDEIREQTLKSVAPALIYEDSSLIKRAIRDIYTRDVDEIWVEGEAGYRAAKDYMRLLMPSHAKKVHLYRDRVPLFHRYQVEAQLEAMYRPVVQLRSGGYIVINPTEALVSIDINSGRATKEHNIEETAYKTNLEAAEEIARQLRLRDMAGLVVIDFIDMEDKNNIRNVERRLKEALKNDRARIQVGRISNFGLLEMSRQRLRTGVLEASTHVCPHCNGAGFLRTVQSSSLHVLRALEEEAIKGRASHLHLYVPAEIAIYILNRKRAELSEMEARYGITIEVEPKAGLIVPNYEIERSGPPPAIAPVEMTAQPVPAEEPEEEDNIAEEEEVEETAADEPRAASQPRQERAAAEGEEDGRTRRRRRRRRRRRHGENGETGAEAQAATAEAGDDAEAVEAQPAEGGEAAAADAAASGNGEAERRRRRRRGGDRGERAQGLTAEGTEAAEAASGETETAPEAEAVAGDAPAAAPVAEAEAAAAPAEAEAPEAPAAEAPADAEAAAKPKRRTRRTTRAKAADAETPAEAPAEVAAAPAPAAEEAPAADAPAEAAPAEEEAAPKPKRRRTTAKAKAAETETAATEEKPARATRTRTRKTTKAAAAAAAPEAAPAAPEAAPGGDEAGSEPSPEPAIGATSAPAAEAAAPVPVEAPAPLAANESQGAANDATAEAQDQPRPARRGWWQRTFSSNS